MVVTQRMWPVRLSIVLLAVVAFVVASAATMAAWWYWGPVSQPFEYVNHEQDRAEVDGRYVTINRTLIVRRTVELHITRELVQQEGVAVRRVQLPASRATYAPGEYRIARPLLLPPGVPAGTYAMHNVVHWQINPLREGALALPPAEVQVP